ncbi:hypothetical protein HBB16_05220 [Pseudonocardia sp. MCCB 268]|nr:hypothetical protein [Pseudonocardia cytotoxica]
MTDGQAGSGPAVARTSFIGSFCEAPDRGGDRAARGHRHAAAVGRSASAIDDVLAAGFEDITVNGRDVDSYHPSLLDLLGYAQRRLGRSRQLLRIRGLHPAPLSVSDGE